MNIAQGITQAADRIVAIQKQDANALALLQSRLVTIEFPTKNGREAYIAHDPKECDLHGEHRCEWIAVIHRWDAELRCNDYRREFFTTLADAVESIVGRQ